MTDSYNFFHAHKNFALHCVNFVENALLDPTNLNFGNYCAVEFISVIETLRFITFEVESQSQTPSP